MGKDRSWLELKDLALRMVHRDAQNIGRQKVARELDAFEASADGVRETLRQRRFPDARHVFDEQMPSREQRDGRQFDHMIFAFDHPLDVALKCANFRADCHDRTSLTDSVKRVNFTYGGCLGDELSV